jgi:hypothetical protein
MVNIMAKLGKLPVGIKNSEHVAKLLNCEAGPVDVFGLIVTLKLPRQYRSSWFIKSVMEARQPAASKEK